MKLTVDLSISSARHRPRGGWTPAKLFTAGAAGAWFDPSDRASLFQDAAGLIPVTASGQPVGLMLDKSGAGRHASQSTTSARPIYRTLDGKHWLEFDGVDDRMQLLAPVNLDNGMVFAALVEAAGRSGTAAILSPSNAGYIAIVGTGAARGLAKNASGSARSIDTPSTFGMTARSAVSIRVQGGTIYARRAGSAIAHSNSIVAASGLNSTNMLMGFSSSGGTPARMDLYGMVLVEGAVSSEDQTLCLTYANGKVA